jgi:hypothetical protein
MRDLNQVNQELLFVLGVSLRFVLKYKPKNSSEETLKKWVLNAMESLIYKNESPETMPSPE